MKNALRICIILLLLTLGGSTILAQTGLLPEVAPGTLEQQGHPSMGIVAAAHKLVAPAADEVVLYYYRPDGKYQDWGFWLWANPGGDGSKVWDKSSMLQVAGGVAYLKFKRDGNEWGVPLVGSKGSGVIARMRDKWTKDGDKDRFFDSNISNAWVIFSGDQKTYPLGEYKPTIDSATLTGPTTLRLELSGRHGLSTEPSSNGFVIKSSDGTITYPVLDMVNAGVPDDRSKNYARRIIVTLGQKPDLSKGIDVSHPEYLAPRAVLTHAVAIAQAEETTPPADYPLGAIYDPAKKSVEFRLWAPLAEEVTVRIYKTSEGSKADWTLPLAKNQKTGVWTRLFADTDPDMFFYEYIVKNGGTSTLVLDPNARSMDVFKGTGPGRAAIVDLGRSDPEGGWEGLENITLAKREDAIIYEVSVRDLTMDPAAGVKNRPGSYKAFIEKLPHLKSLGVTHLQLMPVLNFYYNDESRTAYESSGKASDNNYNWGYDPHNYFTPEGWFASDPSDPYVRIRELKTLIKEAHRLGMGVNLDVVYNHTANASILNDIVPGYYYRLAADGTFTSNSGCGNDTASERSMMRRLIVDSVEYLVREYKIDGFRFDLMGLTDAETILEARKRAAAIKGKENILFVGEGWKMYTGPRQTMMDQNYMDKTEVISVFNDELRDLLKGGGMDDRAKGFISGKHYNPALVLSNMLGAPKLNYKAKAPGNNLNYTEAHDNLTMRDNIANNVGLDDSIPEQRTELVARLRLGNFMVLTSQGIAFLHSGQERGRTKPKLSSTSEVTGNYVHNSYDAADNINQFVWNPHADYLALENYTKGLVSLRRSLEVLRLGSHMAIEKASTSFDNGATFSLAWSLKGSHLGKPATWYFFINSHNSESRSFTLDQDLSKAVVLADKTRASTEALGNPQGLVIKGKTVTLEPLSAIIIRK